MLSLVISVSDEWRFWSGVLPKPPQPTSPGAPEPAAASVPATAAETVRSRNPVAHPPRVIQARFYSSLLQPALGAVSVSRVSRQRGSRNDASPIDSTYNATSGTHSRI